MGESWLGTFVEYVTLLDAILLPFYNIIVQFYRDELSPSILQGLLPCHDQFSSQKLN